VLPHQPYWEQQAGCPWPTTLLPMQVNSVIPPQEPSGLDFRVDEGRLEEVLVVEDTAAKVLDALEATINVGLELQAPYPT